MDSWLVSRRNRWTLNQWTKRNDWGSPKRLSYGVFPIHRQEICNISKISVAFHGICPPFFIQTWLQQYCRCTFFHSACCSSSNPICCRSVWCRRAMIPGKIFTGLTKFQGIVSVNDFRLPFRLQELWQAPLCFLRSFVFARIWLDPLGGQVLQHDCISMIVSRFTIFTENFAICCNQVTKIFCAKYGSAKASSARGPCDVGPLADLAISVFREVSINTVFTQFLTSLERGLWRHFIRRTGVWVSAFRKSIIHKFFSEFLQPLRDVGTQRVSPFFPFNMFTWHSYWIGMYPTQVFPCSSNHTVAWHSWRCHGWWGRRAWGRRGMINLLPWRCHGCWRGKLEEELVDKPGTTIGTKFSVLHCIRISFLMRCGFWPLITFIRVSVFIAKLSER